MFSEEDEEDYEQEKRIKEWLEKQNGQFEYQYINSKGNVRTSNFQGARLDKTVAEDTTTTFLDVITGCDGRDLEYRRSVNVYQEIDKWLFCLGFNEEMSEWIVKIMLKSLELKSSSRLEKFLTSLE